MNCSVNCETKQLEYKACSFILRYGICNVFVCIVLGSVPLFFSGGSLLTVFAWLTHAIWLSSACISHHLASSKRHITSFGLGYAALLNSLSLETLAYSLKTMPCSKVTSHFSFIGCYGVVQDNVLITTMQSENTSSVLCSFNLASSGCFLSHNNLEHAHRHIIAQTYYAASLRSKNDNEMITCV